MDRRAFLKFGLTGAAACFIPHGALAAIQDLDGPARHLSFYNLHTDERLKICYFRQGEYRPDALIKINTLLRDHRTGSVWPIDLRLLDILHALSKKINQNCPYFVISGYRSPKSNAALRARSNGVASRSLHMLGKAIDVRVPDHDTKKLRDAAAAFKAGGVGYYSDPDFIHIDTGPVRYWSR